ncbi:conserved hypothetical protein, partial [Ricinus communis]
MSQPRASMRDVRMHNPFRLNGCIMRFSLCTRLSPVAEDVMQAKNEEAVAHLLNDVVEFARGRLPEPAFAAVEPFL